MCPVFIFMAIFQGVSFVHSRDLVWLYYTKSVLVMLAMHGVLIWWMVQAGGAKLETLNSSSQLSQTTHIWLVLQAFNTGLGTASSLSVNQGDMARYARKPGDQLWVSLCVTHQQGVSDESLEYTHWLPYIISLTMSLWDLGSFGNETDYRNHHLEHVGHLVLHA